MACFIVPLVQAVATSIYRKSIGAKKSASPFRRHIGTLETMLWGGSILLVVDHIINGELTWMFPFLTALETPGGWNVVLREMLTVGVPMSLVLTLAWAIWAVVKDRRSKAATEAE